jgi:hypothetical protein
MLGVNRFFRFRLYKFSLNKSISNIITNVLTSILLPTASDLDDSHNNVIVAICKGKGDYGHFPLGC